MKKKVTIILVLISIFISGCDLFPNPNSLPDSDSSIISKINSDLEWNPSGLNGYNDLVAFCYTDVSNSGATTGFKETLKIYQHDSNLPDELLNLTSIYLGVDTLYHRLNDIIVNPNWIIVTMNHNFSNEGYVSLVSVSDSSNLTLDHFYTISTNIDTANANESFLLACKDDSLLLYDISSGSLILDTTVSSSITTSVPTDNGFFVITENGFVYIDTADSNNITLNEQSNIDIKNSKKAHLYGNTLFIAGPSKYTGKTRIAEVDLSVPSSPSIIVIKDDIIEPYLDFSFDSYQSSYLLLTGSKIIQYGKSGNQFVEEKSENMSTFSNGETIFHSFNGRFYLSGLEVYKFIQ